MARIAFATFMLLASSSMAQNVGVTAESRTLSGVVSLLTNLKAEVEAQRTNETAVYQEFACFCKSETEAKSASIASAHDQTSLFSASVSEKSAEKVSVASMVQTRQAQLNEQHEEYESTMNRCSAERAEFEAHRADIEKAINSMKQAITDLENAKAQSQINVVPSMELLQKSMAIAEAMGIVDTFTSQKVQAFIQQTPARGEYQTRIPPPVEILNNLVDDMTKKKEDLESERAKDKEACDVMLLSISNQIDSNQQALTSEKSQIGSLTSEVATNRGNLVTVEDTLAADKRYLKDLTYRCEQRAKEYDQRYKTQSEEIEAITAAIGELTNTAALLQKADSSTVASKLAPASSSQKVSLLQGDAVRARVRSLRGQALSSVAHDKIVALLRTEAEQLSSPVLATLAAQVAANPFDKVKGMITNLIHKLLDDAKEEAEKKAFCDSQIAKAEKEKEFKLADVQRINADISMLSAQNSTLRDDITLLGEQIVAEQSALAEAEQGRQNETAVAKATMAEQRAAIKSVTKAIEVLQMFYSKASRQEVLLQQTPAGGSRLGAYTGKQAQATDVIGMLNNIIVDSKETIQEIQAADEASKAQFLELEKTAKANIAAKEREVELKEQEVASVLDASQKKLEDLSTAESLVSDAAQTIEELRPQCFQAGQSYAQRLAQIEEEKLALKKALCSLDEKGEEPECKELMQ